MTDEDAEEEAFRDDMAAFRARLPPEAFEPIAVALGKSTVPQSLNAVREWLLQDFYFFHSSCTADPRARTKRERELMRRSKAAAALLASIKPGSLPGKLRDVFDEPFRRRFMAVLEKLADPAGIRARGRHRPKDAFRNDLAPGLVWVYEHITGEKARKPHWLPDSRAYGGAFYRFACAVRRCLYDRLPEVRAALSKTDDALAQELQDHWPDSGTATG
jgi:hypothetical protein